MAEELTDYKHMLKAFRLSLNQKRLLFAISIFPTTHLHSYVKIFPDYEFSSGGLRSGLKKLTSLNLVLQDETGTWIIRNPGFQRWLFAIIKQLQPQEEIEALRFGPWE